MKLARLWGKADGKAVKCRLCEHRCTIPENHYGFCRSRQNKNGKLYSNVYGKLCAAGMDPIEKKPLFHFLPGTNAFSISTTGCNYRCKFCQNWQISQVRVDEMPYEQTTPKDVVKSALATKCKSIAYTYTEPTIFYEFAKDTSKLAVEEKLRNIFVTNGYMTPEMLKDYGPLLHAANVDIKGDERFYREMCGGVEMEHVLANIKRLHKMGVWLEVTTLIIPGYNDDNDSIIEIADFIAGLDPDIPMHFSAFFPQYLMTDTPATPREALVRARSLALDRGVHYAYCGNTFPGDPFENTYCPKCDSPVIRRHGYSINSMDLSGKCPECGHKIAGVFA